MRILAVAAALILAAPVAAQTAGPITTETAVTPLRALGFGTLRGPATPVDAAHPLPTLCMTYSAGALVSCPSSSGGGDPSTTATVGGTPPTTVGMAGLFDGSKAVRMLADTSGRAIVSVYSLPAITGTVGVSNADFGSQCTVVSSDQSFTAGATQRCTMTASGRIKVGLSSAAAEGAAVAGYSDLGGLLGTDGLQHALRGDGAYRLLVSAPLLESLAAGPTPAGTATIGAVGGTQTAGSAPTGGGFRMMGKDGNGYAQDIRTSGSGYTIAVGPDTDGTTDTVPAPLTVGGRTSGGVNHSLLIDSAYRLVTSTPDGANAAIGSTTDAANTAIDGTAASLIGISKAHSSYLATIGSALTRSGGAQVQFATTPTVNLGVGGLGTTAAPLVTQPQDAGAVTVTPGTSSGAVLFDIDTTGYGGAALQLTSMGAGNTVSFYGSNDGATQNIVIGTALSTSTGASATTSTGAFWIPAWTKRLRAVVTTYGSGTVTGTAVLRTSVPPVPAIATPATLNPSLTNATSALTSYRLVSAAGANATLVKGAAGKLFGGQVFNASMATRYLKFFNKGSVPTPGTDVPVLVVAVAAGASVSLSSVVSEYGVSFNTGLAMSTNSTAADSDTGSAVAAGDVVVQLLYL